MATILTTTALYYFDWGAISNKAPSILGNAQLLNYEIQSARTLAGKRAAVPLQKSSTKYR
jgi:hypothetical protein